MARTLIAFGLASLLGLSPSRVAAAPTETGDASPAAAPLGAENAATAPRPAGHRLVVTGVAITVGGVAAYALFGAGLGMGNRAEQDLSALTGSDDIDRRRELLARGQLANRIAIAGGIIAAVTLAVGLPLIVVGRRRATSATANERSSRRLTFGVQGAGAFLRFRM